MNLQDLSRVELEAAFLSFRSRITYLEKEVNTDPLTGLLNRRGLESKTRDPGLGWYVAADLDGFKSAQDQAGRGHAYGDDILLEFADFLTMNTRQHASAFTPPRHPDLLATRTGGDEFTIWCPTLNGARRIMRAIHHWGSHDGEVTASAGLGANMELADEACYIFKLVRAAGFTKATR